MNLQIKHWYKFRTVLVQFLLLTYTVGRGGGKEPVETSPSIQNGYFRIKSLNNDHAETGSNVPVVQSCGLVDPA